MKLIKNVFKVIIYTPIVIVVLIKSLIEILILEIKERLGIKTEVEKLAEEKGIFREKFKKYYEDEMYGETDKQMGGYSTEKKLKKQMKKQLKD